MMQKILSFNFVNYPHASSVDANIQRNSRAVLNLVLAENKTFFFAQMTWCLLQSK